MYIKRRDLFLVGVFVAVVFLVIGCGGSSNDAGGSDGSVVTVERAAVLGAKVEDARGQVAQEIGMTNKYRFQQPPVYPIRASGGTIDINDNGKIEADIDYKLTTVLTAKKGLNITPITTYIADLNETEENDFAKKLGVNIDDLYSLPSKSTAIVALAANAAYYAEVSTKNNSQTKLDDEFETKFLELQRIYSITVDDDFINDNLTKEERERIENDILSELGIPPITEEDIVYDNETYVYNNGEDNIAHGYDDEYENEDNMAYDNITH